MSKDTKLYDLLGVASTCEENEIIIAYFEQAEKNHPDNTKKTDDESILKFNQIKFAYDILSNQIKRKYYDEHGLEATKEKYDKTEEEFNYDNYTSHNYYGHYVDQNDEEIYHDKKYTKNLVFSLKVSLKDLYRGAKKIFDYRVSVICKACQGSGLKKEDEKPKCSKCFDQTEEEKNAKIKEICPECNDGLNESENEIDSCEICKGAKVVSEEKTIEIVIEKGMQNLQKIAFTGLSDQMPGFETGDLIFIIEQAKHERFKRYEDHLIMKHTVNLNEALCGFKFLFRHLDGRVKVVNHSGGEYINYQTIKCIPNLGMPKFNSSSFGDLFIKFNVEFPTNKSLNLEKIKILEEILPEKRVLDFEDEDKDKVVEVTSNHVDKDFFKGRTVDEEIIYTVDENMPEEAFVIRDDEHDNAYADLHNTTQRIECNNQ
ncbi:unnamed protein product [Brachionus calyciflorus]|uniref:J domain-containing protein n=1 Tax=Brachionus calyciflorus TaxID=104777 RepID=A0A813MD26_9BILA|nr:unnamed protein product [Brachionus calyciflorus]